MIRGNLHKLGFVAVVMTLAVLAAVMVSTSASASGSAPAPSRTINGNFCLSQHLFCMSAGLDGQAPAEGYGVNGNGGVCHKPPDTTDPLGGPEYCVPSGTGLLTLRAGTYWIVVNDDQINHNFSIRSCPGSTSPCTATNPAETSEQEITDMGTTYTGPVTMKITLKPGWYRLLRDFDVPVDHENAGMYVDFQVGGLGQTG